MSRKRLVPLVLTIAAVAVVGLWLWNRGFGVSVAISTSQREFKLGDEILLDIVVSGKGGLGRTYSKGWYEQIPLVGHWFWREPPYCRVELRVRDKDGRLCVDPSACISEGLIDKLDVDESGMGTVTLNKYAVLSEAATYEVIAEITMFEWEAKYLQARSYYSKPLDVVIMPRTEQEISAYIEGLLADFNAAKTYESKAKAVRKLICTRDRRMIPALIELAYMDEGTDLASWGFRHARLDHEPEMNDTVLAGARERGLAESILLALQRFGCPEIAFKNLINMSLESNNPRIVHVGVGAAAEYPDDSHMPKLIELAESTTEDAQYAAIKAIICNRTNEGVAALKRRLANCNNLQEAALSLSIKHGYQLRDRTWDWEYGNSEKFARQARDPKSPARWETIRLLVDMLSPEELARVKALIAGNSKEVEVEVPSEGLRVIEDLLADSDSDIRDFVVTCIRFVSSGNPGRPLKPEDFPEIYEEYKKEFGSEDSSQ